MYQGEPCPSYFYVGCVGLVLSGESRGYVISLDSRRLGVMGGLFEEESIVNNERVVTRLMENSADLYLGAFENVYTLKTNRRLINCRIYLIYIA